MMEDNKTIAELNYDSAVSLILDLPKFTVKHTIEESKHFLDELMKRDLGTGDEAEIGSSMRILHVAGTNGKGSVCAYMESVLREAGFTTGCFVSPHLVDVRERIRIDGEMCSKEAFVKAVGQVKKLAEETFYPSFFEFLFFVGMLIFRNAGVEVLILETGLGGRLDATNLIDDKELTVITSIGLDHMEYLGESISDIAREKAGIMRAGVPVVFWEGEASKILDLCANEVGAQSFVLKKECVSDIILKKAYIDFCLTNKYDSICLTVNNRALYQVYNASLAVCALKIWDQRKIITDDDYVAGIAKAFWPGRMEEIEPRIFLDGAHNVPGTEELIRSIARDEAHSRMLIYGCMADKQYLDEIKMLVDSDLFDRYLAVDIDYYRALSAADVAGAFEEAGVKCSVSDDLLKALEMARAYTNIDDGNYVYIAGSLYLVGEVRGLLL